MRNTNFCLICLLVRSSLFPQVFSLKVRFFFVFLTNYLLDIGFEDVFDILLEDVFVISLENI